jgi:hypothetical protein
LYATVLLIVRDSEGSVTFSLLLNTTLAEADGFKILVYVIVISVSYGICVIVISGSEFLSGV